MSISAVQSTIPVHVASLSKYADNKRLATCTVIRS